MFVNQKRKTDEFIAVVCPFKVTDLFLNRHYLFFSLSAAIHTTMPGSCYSAILFKEAQLPGTTAPPAVKEFIIAERHSPWHR